MALARLFAVLILSCLLLGASAAPRVARCATDGNIKSPLSLLIAPSQAEWTPQLSGWTIRVPWAQIEPAEGKYVFTAIDDQLTYADNSDAYGLQGVNIEITTGDSTPGWLLVPTPSGLVAPYWQPRYQQAYRELMARLAYRYDSHRLVRGVALSACTANSAPAEAAAAAGFNALLGLQCHYSAMFTHVSFWVNTPTLLSLPYKVDDAFHHVVEDFRAYFGPRLGVLAITQDLGAASNKDLFELLKHHHGANTVTLTGTLPGNGNIENFFAVAANSHVTGLTLPSRWNSVGDNFVAQWQLDNARSSFASLPNDCAYAPGRAVLSQSVASVPSASVDMRMSLSPDAPISKEKILNAIVALTGMPVSRFQVAKMLPFDGKLNARTFVYNQHYAVPAALVARYLSVLTVADWRSVGLEARSTGAQESLGTGSNASSLDATYIFLIVLAAVVYLCVIVLFCYLMAVVIRYCTSERNATMATISSAGNRVRGWVRFDKDETPGFPTATDAKTAPVTGDAV